MIRSGQINPLVHCARLDVSRVEDGLELVSFASRILRTSQDTPTRLTSTTAQMDKQGL